MIVKTPTFILSIDTDAGTIRISDEETRDSDGSHVEGRAVAIGSIERRISDSNGEHFLAQSTVTFDDMDHFWRSLAVDDVSKFLDGREARLEVISQEALSDAGVKTPVLYGRCIAPNPEDDLSASLIIEEWIASKYGPAFLDKPLNPRKFRKRMHGATMPKELEDKTVPTVIGEVSDLGSINPVTGAPADKGLCPGFFTGYADANGDDVIGPTLLPAPPAPTYMKFGAGGTHTYSYAAVVRLTTGGRTSLGAPVTITGLPALNDFSSTNGVILYLAQYAPDLQAQVSGIDLYVKDGSPSSPGPWRYMDGAGEMFNTSADTPYNAGPNFNSGGIGYEDNGDDSHNKTWNPPPTTNTADVATGGTWGRIVFADSGISGAVDFYGSDGGDPATATGDPVRVSWGDGSTLSDVVTPYSGGWPHANPYVDMTDPDGVTERFYCIYVRKGSPRLEHHISGRVTIAANLCGRGENPDGTGATICQAFPAWQHLLSENGFANNGRGYYTGDWVGLPTFSDGSTAISAQSVLDAQALSALLMGNDEGYLMGVCLVDEITVREFIRMFNKNFTSFSYLRRPGALSIALINTLASVDAGLPLRVDIDDVVSIGAPKRRHDLRENYIECEFDWDADARHYRSEVFKVQDVPSQTSYGIPGRPNIAKRERYSNMFVRDELTARTAMLQRLRLYAYDPWEIPATVKANGLEMELMEQRRVTSYEGIGPDGYILQPAIIIGHTVRPDDDVSIDLTLWAMGDVLADIGEPTIEDEDGKITALWGGDSGEVWGDGSEVWG